MKSRVSFLVFLLALCVQSFVWAEGGRYALIIGNSDYNDDKLKLGTPVNDAADMASALEKLGYNVDLKTNVTKADFTKALSDYVTNLQASSKTSEGFFWYGGHGTEIAGQNYLWPVDVAINSEIAIRESSWSLQTLLAYLGEAGNKMNVVVIDACRDSLPQALPQTLTRGAKRGSGFSTVVPAEKDLFVMMSTAAGQSALDAVEGGRNSPFAESFLKYVNSTEPLTFMATDVINETVAKTSNRQRPYTNGSISDKYYSINPNVQPEPQIPAAAVVQQQVQAAPVVSTPQRRPRSRTESAPVVKTAPAPKPDKSFIEIKDGTLSMGTPATEWNRRNDEIQHSVKLSGFYIQEHELTQAEYRDVMGVNPSKWKGDNLPVENVTWYDAIEYCNLRSVKEGLTPAYNIDKIQMDNKNLAEEEIDNIKWVVTWNTSANGYRLPTEAEWEYACRAGISGPFDKGNKFTIDEANFDGHYPWATDKKYKWNIKGTWLQKTQPVGSYAKNRWGLFDMHGNVREWCWDWYGEYSTAAQSNPAGADSGREKIIRGGSWFDGSAHLRAGERRSLAASRHDDYTGFRLVRGL